MLAFLTGNSVNEWLYIQSKRAKKLNNRQKLIHKNDQFFLSSQFNVFENRNFEYSDKLAQSDDLFRHSNPESIH